MTDGHDEIATEGRDAVRVHFVQRVRDAGLLRPKGVTEANHAEGLKGLVEWLAYMDGENLKTLAELVIDQAAGGRWPSEVVIRQLAKSLQPKPATENRIMTSWLASIEGPSAQMRGDLVELFRFLRQHGRPPMAMDKRDIATAAEENQRQRLMIEDRISRNVATRDDREWIDAWAADHRAANDIVRGGAERRAQKAASA